MGRVFGGPGDGHCVGHVAVEGAFRIAGGEDGYTSLVS